MPLAFRTGARDAGSRARRGTLVTAHGTVETPAFMPVGTRASVKAVAPRDLGSAVVLANTYHLLLQPGVDLVERVGGLHAFMRWDGPILTDSGGFQVFSLVRLREVTDAGVQFASHLDGTPMLLTPECVIEAQQRLGADLIMPLDECVAADAPRSETERALARTQLWWERSLAVPQRADQALFALVQGGLFADLRQAAARQAVLSDPPGYAIGGLSVGEPKHVTAALLLETLAELPVARPRYLMGVGHPADLATYAAMGVDLFDCVLPTRLGRNGTLWVDDAGTRLDLNRRAVLHQRGPIKHDCGCAACSEWHVGSLAAMFQEHEQLAYRLASAHNIQVLVDLLDDLRQRVLYTARC